jgi:hypothetical protein
VIIQPAQSLKKCQDKCNTIQKLDVSIVAAINYSYSGGLMRFLFHTENTSHFSAGRENMQGRREKSPVLHSYILSVGRAGGTRLGCREFKTSTVFCC